ncbi:MAG: ATP-binding protein [Chloroflexota bacterium]
MEGLKTQTHPLHDPHRLEALGRSALLDTPPEESFDRLTRLATKILRVPVALVVLVDKDRQFFKSGTGLPEPVASARQTPLSHSFCQHSLTTGQPLIIEDARDHPLVRDNLAVPEMGVIAYAGIPLVTSEGDVLGSFCIIDHKPRVWNDEEVDILKELAASVMTEIELRTVIREAQEQGEQRARAEQEREALSIREREAGARAETAEKTLAAVIERVPTGLALVDATGAVVFMNEVARRISGRLPNGEIPLAFQAADYRIRDPLTHRSFNPEETAIARALAGEIVENEETIFRPPNESEDMWVQTSAVPLYDSDGRITGAIAVFSDITADRALEQQKDDFLSAAAHDLKTPLTTIKGFSQLIQRRLTRAGNLDPEQLSGDLRQIDATATKMVALINELQDIARIRMAESLTLNRQPTDLVLLVGRAVVEQQQISPDHIISVDTSEAELTGMWDASRLERVIANLLSNAVKYSPEGGEIEVQVVREEIDGEPQARLSVRDDGLGIPAADLPRIFDRFYRASNVTGNIGGTGIGLAAVRQIVEQHGGSATVESSEGAGTTFVVRLPLEGESS